MLGQTDITFLRPVPMLCDLKSHMSIWRPTFFSFRHTKHKHIPLTFLMTLFDSAAISCLLCSKQTPVLQSALWWTGYITSTLLTPKGVSHISFFAF